MLKRLSIGSAVILLTIIIAATLNTPIRDTYPSKLFADYAKRFVDGGTIMFIEWIMPAELPKLAEFSDVIVLGTVTQRVNPSSDFRTEGEVFEIKVNTYLKAPDYVDPNIILISQINGESNNPIIQPGDECVFFLTAFYGQKAGPGMIYSLGGDYTRYVVYGGRVYSVAFLNPENSSSDASVIGESLPRFLARVRNMVD